MRQHRAFACTPHSAQATNVAAVPSPHTRVGATTTVNQTMNCSVGKTIASGWTRLLAETDSPHITNPVEMRWCAASPDLARAPGAARMPQSALPLGCTSGDRDRKSRAAFSDRGSAGVGPRQAARQHACPLCSIPGGRLRPGSSSIQRMTTRAGVEYLSSRRLRRFLAD